jgi:hypothetical protein
MGTLMALVGAMLARSRERLLWLAMGFPIGKRGVLGYRLTVALAMILLLVQGAVE